MVRPFELPDLMTLHKYRKQGVYLDSQTVLTLGRIIVPMRAVFSPLSEAVGVFTGVEERHGLARVIGQASHALGAATARMTFMTPDKRVDPDSAAALVEYLLKRLGEREAQTLIAEVDENTATFETLRRLNFSIYARQRIWRISSPARFQGTPEWRAFLSVDGINARKLHFATVPSLVQQIESYDFADLRGWVLYRDDEMLGYAEVTEGPRGIWVQPFIHPEMEDVHRHLASLIGLLRPRARRPVYLCVRSYQAGLTNFLEAMQADTAATQAVMARRLTALVQKAELSPLRAMNGTTEVTTPTHSSQLSVDNNGR
jgi:hypothetical protein